MLYVQTVIVWTCQSCLCCLVKVFSSGESMMAGTVHVITYNWSISLQANPSISLPAGQVDAFSVTPVFVSGTDTYSITPNQPIVWGNVLVNIQGGYNVTTGMCSSTYREGMTSLQVCNINIQGGYDVTTGM